MLILEKAGIELSLDLLAESADLVGVGLEGWFESHHKTVALSVLILQMLNPAHALELTVDHDPETGTESLAFLHAAREPTSPFTADTIPRSNVRVGRTCGR